jgi:acetyl esterase/lipase
MSIAGKFLFLAAAIDLIAPHLHAQAADPLTPTMANVPYGKHARQVLDFYQARSEQPAPLLFFIHGGGWMTGDKANPDSLAKCLENGISVVSTNYRFIPDAVAEKIAPPVKACLDDAARALQFVRSKAGEWRIDKDRIGGCGGSAGGFTALWLAFHPDLADFTGPDPISRESTRLRCVLAFVPQTSLDPRQLQAWIPNIQYGNHAFALGSMQEFLDKREALLPWIQKFSPYELASADDPPVLLFYDNPPNLGQPYKDPPHSANFGAGLEEKLKAVGIEHEINYNNDYGRMKYPDLFRFLLTKLKGEARESNYGITSQSRRLVRDLCAGHGSREGVL